MQVTDISEDSQARKNNMSAFRYPPAQVLKKLKACNSVTLFGSTTDIYKVIFWDKQNRPYIIELKEEFTGETDFGDPSLKWRKDLESMPLIQTHERTTARRKLQECDYSTGSKSEYDTYLFVMDLLKNRPVATV